MARIGIRNLIDRLTALAPGLDALQTADGNGVACSVNWRKGDKVIVPPPKTDKEVAARKALDGVERLDFYLIRMTL
jgi:peroxiredoxin (alkyl hydroperoxide reductase subunit C)